MPTRMRPDAGDRRARRRALVVSAFVHLVVVALLIFGLPTPPPQPPDEEAISVELVPPPEPPPQPQPPKSGQDSPLPVLQPVVQFGEKDSGPKISPEGNSPTEGSPSPTSQPGPDKADHAQPPAVTVAKAEDEIPRPGTGDTPVLMPQPAPKPQATVKLRQAKTLFSQRATADPLATIAMANVPRDVRAARLCATELKEQLLHASPSRFPEIVPFERLKEGTVIEDINSAFRSNFEWYKLSYRCELDAEVTKVVGFAFDIGKPLTAEEWKRRNLPSD